MRWRQRRRLVCLAFNLKRLHGAESEFYLKRRPPYRAKNGWFHSPEELLLVRNVTPALFYGAEGRPGLRDIFSVYNRSGTVNVRTAPAAVLQVLLGTDAASAADLVAQRDSDAGGGLLPQLQAQLTAIDPRLVSMLVDQPPATVLLEARGDTQAQRNRSNVAAVVTFPSEGAEDAKIVRWFDRAPWTGALPGGARPGGEEPW